MKVAITGATGFLGSHIARELHRQGHELRVLVRKTSKLDALASIPFEKIEGDILDGPSVERLLEGAQALFHVAAHTGARKRDKEMLYKVNVEGTRTVLEAAAKVPKLRVIMTSTIAAVGASWKREVLDESASWTVGGSGYHYPDSKKQGEDVALDFAKRGLDLVLLNPAFILGPGDVYFTSTRYVLEYMKGLNRVYLPGGLSFCDVRDVARAHVAALTKGRAGERYIVAGPNHTYEEVQKKLYELSGLHRPIRLPYALAWLAALTLEGVSLVKQHGLEEMNRPFMKYSTQFAFFDSSKAQRELGYQVRPLEEMLADTLRDFVARGLVAPRTEKLRALSPAA
jgi:dihydroflavonol-4-reductase